MKKNINTPSNREIHKEVLESINDQKVFFLITGSSLSDCIDVSMEIKKGGYDLIGLDFRLAGVKDRLKSYKKTGRKEFGVFSIHNRKQARIAINAGARFIFSIHPDKGVIRKCRRESIFHSAGAITPYEIHLCNELKSESVSLYPCDLYKGFSWAKFLMNSYPNTRIIPTDDFGSDKIIDYLSLDPFAIARIIDTSKFINIQGLLEELESFRSQ